MATPVFNPDLPADHSLISAGELRAQFVSLEYEIQSKVDGDAVDAAITAQAAGNCDAVANLALTVSNPPTQAEVQALADKLDELLNALKRV